jgi:hypothetical protein
VHPTARLCFDGFKLLYVNRHIPALDALDTGSPLTAPAIEEDQLLPGLHAQDLHMTRGACGQENTMPWAQILIDEEAGHGQNV